MGDTESQPSVLRLLPAKSAAPKSKSVKAEINLARQSLVDFKKERNVLEKEIDSGASPRKHHPQRAQRQHLLPPPLASNASKDDGTETADAANSNDANNTADTGTDANNAKSNSKDNSNQMLEEALKRIEKLELEVVQ